MAKHSMKIFTNIRPLAHCFMVFRRGITKLLLVAVWGSLLCGLAGCTPETDKFLAEVSISRERIVEVGVAIPPRGSGLPWRLCFSGDFAGDPRLKSGSEPVTLEVTNRENYPISVARAGGSIVHLGAGESTMLFDGTLGGLFMCGRGQLVEFEVYSARKEAANLMLKIQATTVWPPINARIFAVRCLQGL